MAPATDALFDRVGIAAGARCLDVGCGGGDAVLELARRVGADGHVTGIDADAAVIDIARKEAAERGVTRVDFRVGDVNEPLGEAAFDIVYARFLLTHVQNPERVVANMLAALKLGGLAVVEDIDFSGHFCYPASAPFDRYVALYSAVARKRGVDPDIGPRLPLLLRQAGVAAVAVNVAQPCGLEGDVKLIAAITMEKIADAVLAAGLADATDIDSIVAELYRVAGDPTVLMSIPRIVQSWGRKV